MYNGVLIPELLREDIINAISDYEPRIVVTSNDITIVQNERTVQIYIQYEVKETGEVNDFNLEVSTEDNPYK